MTARRGAAAGSVDEQPAAPSSPAGARRVGRPRRNLAESEVSPRDQILIEAARLFGEVGYNETTMSDIARAAGLQQSSLYYWFRRKELILQATLSVNRVPVEFLERLENQPGSPGLKLYRMIRFDTHQLCVSPFDVNEIDRLAEGQPEVFSQYWEDNERLYRGIIGFLEAGRDQGQLIDGEPGLLALGLLSAQEGMQRRYRFRDRHAPGGSNPFRYASYEPAAVATTVADMAVRAVLRRPGSLGTLRRQAAAHHDF